jgi:cytochrome P450 family 4
MLLKGFPSEYCRRSGLLTEFFSSLTYRITKIIFKRVIDPITHSDFIYKFTSTWTREEQLVKTLHEFSNDVIKKRKSFLREKHTLENQQEIDVGGKRKLAFLDLLLLSEVNGKPLSDEGIREEVDTFMFEGIIM